MLQRVKSCQLTHEETGFLAILNRCFRARHQLGVKTWLGKHYRARSCHTARGCKQCTTGTLATAPRNREEEPVRLTLPNPPIECFPMAPLWPYATPGIPDALFEQLPGIPISKREVRLLIVGALRLQPSAVLWDIGAGTGTIAVEAALLCPAGQVVAIERDADVVQPLRHSTAHGPLRNPLN